MNRLVIAGTHSGSGKTTVTVGLLAALRKRGLKVQPFKVGPDYIDTGYHLAAAGRAAYNLDSWMLPCQNILQLFTHGMTGMDLGIIEGVMGLYDGVGSTPTGSTAEMARLLDAPVVLVVDAGGMSTSAAAQVLGYKSFDKNLRMNGVIINNVGNERHFQLVKEAVETYTEVPVLGYLPREAAVSLPSRHLGLLPADEIQKHEEIINQLAALVEKTVDLDQVIRLGIKAGLMTAAEPLPPSLEKPESRVRIAVARDKSFNFYYRSTLELLAGLGAELVFFSPLNDNNLPEGADGLYLGGGFPDVFARGLASNTDLRENIRCKLEDGLPCYAESGGLIYLTEGIVTKDGEKHPLVGFFDGKAVMTGSLQRFGYVSIEFSKENILGKKGRTVRGHEFHYSLVEGITSPTTYLVESSLSGNRWRCGYCKKNVLAAYAHIDLWGYPELAGRFLKVCRGKYQESHQGTALI